MLYQSFSQISNVGKIRMQLKLLNTICLKCINISQKSFTITTLTTRPNLNRSYFKSKSLNIPRNNFETLIISARLRSWWTRRNGKQRYLTQSQFDRNRDGIHDANILFKDESTTKMRIIKTKEKIKETKVRMTKKMEDIKENILTIPNALCVGRIIATPFIGYLVIQEIYVPALSIFVLAGLTDMLDGYIARNYKNQKSKFGSFLDPAADKFLIATLFLTLTVSGLIPVPLTGLIITRDVLLFGAGCYIRYVSLPQPKTFSRYFNATLATASMSPTFISKLNTAVQLTLVAVSLAAPIFNYVDHEYLKMLWYLTAGSTIASGASYLFTKNTYKIFKSKI